MTKLANNKPSLISRVFLHGVTHLLIFIYVCLLVFIMRIFGLPYEPLTEKQTFVDALIMAAPLFAPVSYLLSRWGLASLEKVDRARAKIRAYKGLAILLPSLAVYSFLFLYININLAPGGEKFCSGRIEKRTRIRMRNGTSHRLWVVCEASTGESLRFEQRVSKKRFESVQPGELWPVTYVTGFLGLDLKKISHR